MEVKCHMDIQLLFPGNFTSLSFLPSRSSRKLASTHELPGEQQRFLEALLSHQMKSSLLVVIVKAGQLMLGSLPATYRETDGGIN